MVFLFAVLNDKFGLVNAAFTNHFLSILPSRQERAAIWVSAGWKDAPVQIQTSLTECVGKELWIEADWVINSEHFMAVNPVDELNLRAFKF